MSNTAKTADYQTLPLSVIDESPTNPRRTFEPEKLKELADSIRAHGLIQPITVRPVGDRYEIVAGARRFRATQIAEQETVFAIVRDLTDHQALEVQLIENAQRQDVHPYEEAAGYERVLQLPGYDTTAVAIKTGKSLSHIYARLALLQLIPEIAEAFQHDRITASHANLLARLPEHHQKEAFKQCWRTDYMDKEPHLRPAKHLSSWIQSNLYLPLGDAPFATDDPLLNAEAGACTTCPRRSGYNTQLFADVEGDQCLDAPCYQSKIDAHINRELAAQPQLVQIETGWRNANDRRPGAITNLQWRQITTPDNPDAEPPCEYTRTGIIVFGRGVGKSLTVCIGQNCPVHDPKYADFRATNPLPVMEPIAEEETEEEKAEREAEYERRQAEFRAEVQREEAARQEEEDKRQQEYVAAQERQERLQKKREATYQHIIQVAPDHLNAAQLRVLLRALASISPYTFAVDWNNRFSPDPDNDSRSVPEIIRSAVDALTDEKLSGFAVKLALCGHRRIPKDADVDILAEAAAVFLPKDNRNARTPTSKRVKTTKKATVTKPAGKTGSRTHTSAKSKPKTTKP